MLDTKKQSDFLLEKSDLSNRQKSFKSYLKVMILCFLVVFSLDLLVSYFFVGKYIMGADNWIAVAQTRKKDIAKSISGKRILIVSGSNALFGISAKKIYQETGVPTVNLATHAALGVKYTLDDAKTILKEGDIVLLPLEYSTYTWGGNFNETYLKHVLSHDTNYFNNLSISAKFNHVIQLSNIDILSSLVLYKDQQEVLSELKAKALKKKCYTGFTLNEFGDELCNIGQKPLDVMPNALKIPKNYTIDPTGVIAEFLDWCKQNKIKVLALYPVMQKQDQYQKEKYQIFFNKIKEYYQYNGTLLLGDPYQATLPNELMFNTQYHPNDRGRDIRTQQIISLIKPYIK
ncbi:hypothetical protein I8751_06620 [Nostocaceae cyanobacterium CENA357]|uniref:Uncharacterized protein n=1 Tax=Atlanticothrix silvestris CENA357 TaxID=1725252 RepID=A0A8J7KXT0_9CYAN|nr:hypothetical protein [Atlanticothrix silvestris]MBH8552050.1 hypothetical protein [Atlanticothrix silvestris CENA357]